MKYFVMIAMLASVTAHAEQTKDLEGKILSVKNGKPKTYDQEKYVVVRKEATEAYRRKMARLKELEEENERLRNSLASQPVTQPIEIIVMSRPAPKNSLSLLGGASTTDLYVSRSSNVVRAGTDYEFDTGLMYQRDFEKLRASVAATLRGSVYLGIGFNF